MYQPGEIEDNFETLKNLFINMSEAIKYLEQKETMLEKDNKTLNDANKLLQESTERLVKLNEKQQEMLGTLNESLDKIKLLETELEDMKKENLKLKASFGTRHEKAQCSLYTDEQVSEFKDSNNMLLLQNRLLKEQLINFRNLHYQTMSEYRLNNMMNANDGSQEKNNIDISHMDIDLLNQDQLQPLQVNVIDSDLEDNS